MIKAQQFFFHFQATQRKINKRNLGESGEKQAQLTTGVSLVPWHNHHPILDKFFFGIRHRSLSGPHDALFIFSPFWPTFSTTVHRLIQQDHLVETRVEFHLTDGLSILYTISIFDIVDVVVVVADVLAGLLVTGHRWRRCRPRCSVANANGYGAGSFPILNQVHKWKKLYSLKVNRCRMAVVSLFRK